MLGALEDSEKHCKAVRDKAGNRVDIMLECYGRATLLLALGLVQKLHRYRPLWIEEPLFTENIEAMAELRRRSKIPIAAEGGCSLGGVCKNSWRSMWPT